MEGWSNLDNDVPEMDWIEQFTALHQCTQVLYMNDGQMLGYMNEYSVTLLTCFYNGTKLTPNKRGRNLATEMTSQNAKMKNSQLKDRLSRKYIIDVKD